MPATAGWGAWGNFPNKHRNKVPFLRNVAHITVLAYWECRFFIGTALSAIRRFSRLCCEKLELCDFLSIMPPLRSMAYRSRSAVMPSIILYWTSAQLLRSLGGSLMKISSHLYTEKIGVVNPNLQNYFLKNLKFSLVHKNLTALLVIVIEGWCSRQPQFPLTLLPTNFENGQWFWRKILHIQDNSPYCPNSSMGLCSICKWLSALTAHIVPYISTVNFEKTGKIWRYYFAYSEYFSPMHKFIKSDLFIVRMKCYVHGKALRSVGGNQKWLPWGFPHKKYCSRYVNVGGHTVGIVSRISRHDLCTK